MNWCFKVFLLVFLGKQCFANDKIIFPTQNWVVGKSKITVEIADNLTLQSRGLMFRENLDEGKGMLFIYEKERVMSFWMKNTLIPLSIGFFNKESILTEIQDMVPAVLGEAKIPTYTSKTPSKFALEVPKGWFKKVGIKIGDRLKKQESP